MDGSELSVKNMPITNKYLKRLPEFICIVIVLIIFGYYIVDIAKNYIVKHQNSVEQSYRDGCNESTEYRKVEQCANMASKYTHEKNIKGNMK